MTMLMVMGKPRPVALPELIVQPKTSSGSPAQLERLGGRNGLDNPYLSRPCCIDQIY